MLGALKARGFESVSQPENADIILVNTCAFLTSAVQEGVDKILELSLYKTTGRCRKLIVAGCMVERFRVELEKEFPEVDRFVSTDELLTVADEENTTEEYDESMPRVVSTTGNIAYVKISEGCNRPCSFCIIPKIRGNFRSRSISSVVSEVNNLVEQGVKEVNLVAQDLTAYGNDFSGNRGVNSELSKLLRELEMIDKNYWVRLFYAYPVGITEELLETIQESKVVCNYLDMPLQHISGPVLKRMRRPLGEKGTRSLIEHMHKKAPEVALRTTFIVGFPGETNEDIEALANFIREEHFSHVGIFTYSDEEEADSFSYDGRVAETVKEERRDYLLSIQQEIVAKKMSSYVGKQEKVLVTGYHEESDLLLVGRTSWQGPEVDGEVIINDVPENKGKIENLIGQFCQVEFTELAGYDLVARVLSN